MWVPARFPQTDQPSGDPIRTEPRPPDTTTQGLLDRAREGRQDTSNPPGTPRGRQRQLLAGRKDLKAWLDIVMNESATLNAGQ